MNLSISNKIGRISRRNVEQLCDGLYWLLVSTSAAIISWIIFQSASLYLKTEADIAKSDQAIQAAILNSAQSSQRSKVVKPDFRALAKKNLFGSLTPSAQPVQEVVAPKENKQLGLIGTFLTDNEAPYAIIENKKDGEQDVFEKNDSVFEAAKLVEIAADHVKIDRNGQIEILSIEDGSSESSTSGSDSGSSGDTIQVDAGELDNALSNLPVLLTQARAVPYFKDGASIGLRLFAIRPGSLFEKIGLKNGDILKSINGSSLADITQAIKLFEKLKEEKRIGLVLERNREEQSLTYVIN
jgi:general secretion pathway protein C